MIGKIAKAQAMKNASSNQGGGGGGVNSQTAKWIVYGVVGMTILGLAYFGIIKPVLDKVGLTRSKDERKGDRDEDKLSRKQIFSPQLYRDNKSKQTLGSGKANLLAYTIKRADKWGCCDDETLAVGSIKKAGSKVNISYIASVFQDNYGADLHAFLFDDVLTGENKSDLENYSKTIKKF